MRFALEIGLSSAASSHPLMIRIPEVSILLRVPFILVVSVLVTGCATGANRDLPKCDGTAKRPLNAGLWVPSDPELARQMKTATNGRVLFRQEPAAILGHENASVVQPYAPQRQPMFPIAVPAGGVQQSAASSSTTC